MGGQRLSRYRALESGCLCLRPWLVFIVNVSMGQRRGIQGQRGK